MFCSNNFTLKIQQNSFLTQIKDSCLVELLNIACFFSYIYVLVLLFIHVKWSPNKHIRIVARRKLFYGHTVRSCLMLLLLLLHLIEFGDSLLKNTNIWYLRLVPMTALISNITCQIFYNKLEKYDKYCYLVVTSIFWFFCGLFRILIFFATLNLGLNFIYVQYTSSFLVAVLCFLLVFTDFITLFQENKNCGCKEISPNTFNESICAYKHVFSSWYSRITFYWLTPILHIGYATSYSASYFGQLPNSEKSTLQFDKLQRLYLNEKSKMKTTKNKDSVCLWTCFSKCYWKTFIFGGFLKLLGDIIGFIPPLGISVIVRYIETIQQNQDQNENVERRFIKWSEFLSNGYIMSVIVLISVLGQGTLSQNSTHIINVEGIRLKNALQGLIYSKLMKIRKNSISIMKNNNCDNVGYITNLITEDTYNVMSCFWIGNYIWAIPLKITISVYLLYREIGISSVIASIGCIIIMLFLQLIIGTKMSKNYKFIAKWNDIRLRRINEILQGIRFIKLYCWESDFFEEVSNLRKKELDGLNLDSIYWTNITFLANTSSIIIAVATFMLHYWIENTQISLHCLFTSLALFNQLTVPLFIFPVMVPIIVTAVISNKRIETFLSLPEMETPIQGIDETERTKKTNTKEDLDDNNAVKTTRDECNEYNNLGLRKIAENSENEDENNTKIEKSDDDVVLKINKIVCSWNDLQKPFLEIDDITIHSGTLNIIIGAEGSGKTSLLNALLGEMTCYSGKIQWKKSLRIGYVPQSPWLLNDTVKENILFGCPFQEEHFARVIQSCALKFDINSMPNKEYTVIGDRGIALCGGQKQKIMIARMFYSKPEIVLMDDPFSSLDSKTVNYIFENGIRKFVTKKNKTVIMTTTFKKFLPYSDQLIVMENCKLKEAGSFADVTAVAPNELQILDERGKYTQTNSLQNCSEDENKYSHKNQKASTFVPLKRRRSTLSGSRYFTHDLPLPTDDCDIASDALLRKRKRSRAATVTEYSESSSFHQDVYRVSSLQTPHTSQQYLKKNKKKCDLVEEICFKRHQSTVSDFSEIFDEYIEKEDASNEILSTYDLTSELDDKTDSNEFRNYVTYIKSCGLFIVLLYFVLTFGWQVVRILTNFWLTVSFLNTKTLEKQEVRWYMYWYIFLSFLAIILSLFSTAVGQYAGSVSRKLLHKKMLNSMLKCPAHSFDHVCFGQIINRFSTDVEIIDKKISTSTQRLIQFLLLCTSAILVNCIITPWFIILVIPITLLYYMVQKFYRCSCRELQHLESILKTPIINHYSESFGGLEIIRALNQQNTFLQILFQKVDAHANVFLILNSTNRWLGIMLDYLGGLIVFAAMIISLISISVKPTLEISSFLGLAINYTLLLPIYLTWVVKFLADLEIYMGAVDRIQRFIDIPAENYNSDVIIPENWPNKGAIQFKNVTLRYYFQGRCVIQNLNLSIYGGQKIGICGHTGSGKSSLMMSLLKMVPFIEGEIILDGIDVRNVSLKSLRSKISIVPQDVILFGGNIRQNLDRRCEFTDEELWECLKLVQIHETVTNMGGLNAKVQDGGSNLSAAERQLICLARAILRDTCCLILDEATNSLQSDAEIEFLDIVLNIFRNRTVIVITHRASNLLHFERILVLDNGVLIEDGSPKDLLQNSNSKFFNFIKVA